LARISARGPAIQPVSEVRDSGYCVHQVGTFSLEKTKKSLSNFFPSLCCHHGVLKLKRNLMTEPNPICEAAAIF
jgi:hypothetical protein